MTRCIDLFIDEADLDGAGALGVGGVGAVGGGLAAMAEVLTYVTGLHLAEDRETGTWVGTVEGARVELAAHDFLDDAVDDRHLALSTYRYDLFARVPSAEATNSPEAALLRRVLGLIKADGRFRAVLIWDLQNVIERAGASSAMGG